MISAGEQISLYFILSLEWKTYLIKNIAKKNEKVVNIIHVSLGEMEMQWAWNATGNTYTLGKLDSTRSRQGLVWLARRGWDLSEQAARAFFRHVLIIIEFACRHRNEPDDLWVSSSLVFYYYVAKSHSRMRLHFQDLFPSNEISQCKKFRN